MSDQFIPAVVARDGSVSVPAPFVAEAGFEPGQLVRVRIEAEPLSEDDLWNEALASSAQLSDEEEAAIMDRSVQAVREVRAENARSERGEN